MIQPLTEGKRFTLVPGSEGLIETQKLEVSIGPQHPSTHGVFRMDCMLDGETVIALKPVMGYLHRNHEQLAERMAWLGSMPYTDRLDYFNSMTNNWAYALAVEKLAGIKVPERADYVRVIMSELTRILNHSCVIGFMLQDLGAWGTPLLYAFREREKILDLFEAVSGSRMMCNYMRFGGVAYDLPEGWTERARDLVWNRLPRAMDEFDDLLTGNEIFTTRTRGLGVLSAHEAIAYSMAGPMLRASGVPYDVRRAQPYSIYNRFDFDVITRPEGDVYARFMVRMREIRESIRILKQALDGLPAGPILPGKKNYQMKVPAGTAYSRVEGPKGELGFFVVSDGKPNPYRYHVRAPTFINLTSLEKMCLGTKIADTIVIFGAVDIVLGEVDR